MDFRCQDCSRSRVNYLSSRISHDATSYPASTSDNYLARYDTYCREFDLKHHFYCILQTSDHFFSEEPVLSIRLPSWQLGWWGRPRGRFSWNVAACDHTKPTCRFRCAAQVVYVPCASLNDRGPFVSVVGWEGHALSASVRPAQSTHRAGLSSLGPFF